MKEYKIIKQKETCDSVVFSGKTPTEKWRSAMTLPRKLTMKKIAAVTLFLFLAALIHAQDNRGFPK